MIIADSDKIKVNQDSFRGDSSRSGLDVGIGVVTDLSLTECERSSRNYTISPGGKKYYIPSCVVENCMPYTNQVFESVDQGYQFYNTYARLGGFSIRKTTEKLDDAGTVLLKHFVCSCEGFNNPKDDPNVLKKRHSVTRRCGCHHFLQSSREMTTSLRNICYNGAKVNIGVSKSFSFAKKMYGGYANVGASLQDFRNFNRDLKLFIGDKDAHMMIDKFKRIQDKSKAFNYAYDVDYDGRLTKLFWDVSIGCRNFEFYNLIFAPFTSVDKHDRCVTFASCLLSHESVVEYSWAFGHLVKAMGRNPVLIITDQCPSMKVYVHDVFSDVNGLIRSKHHLCMWHIMEKFLVKDEVLASCLEMQIKRKNEEVDGVTHFEIRDVRVKDKLFKKFVMCGIVCRHAFCGLKQIGVTKFPRILVLNRWMQTVDSGNLSNLDVVTSNYFEMEQVSLKLNTIWFDFRQAVDKAG
ncbi:protein FAR1-RELATED SEQUENCE 5-like [Apium graveolens]|uniref:protein FAR1-RELATED SEQUENCE 5-like n=1 Tax=Apium graveolens TaxID=4045 RepID=UPI003D79204A